MHALEVMHARLGLVAVAVLALSHPAFAEEVAIVTELSAAASKAKLVSLHPPESLATLKAGHGKTVIAYATDTETKPFHVHVVGTGTTTLARPGKRHDMPFAVAMTPTPTGFTILFQEIEAENQNEAHTYMVTLDKDGKVETKPREVQIPWWLGDMAWNGNGYHLALFYAGDMTGIRLSMVTMTEEGVPQGHPDWASKGGLVSDVHLIANGAKITAYYRGAMGDRLHARDVTKIGNWGTEPAKARDLGALAKNVAVAITDKRQPVRVKRAAK